MMNRLSTILSASLAIFLFWFAPCMAQTKVAIFFDVSDSMRSVVSESVNSLQAQFNAFGEAVASVREATQEGVFCPVDLVAKGWSSSEKYIVETKIDNAQALLRAENAIRTAAGFSNQDTPHAAAIASALRHVGSDGRRQIFLTTDEAPRGGVAEYLRHAVATGVGVTLVVYRGNPIAKEWRMILDEVGMPSSNVINMAEEDGNKQLQRKVSDVFLHCAPSA